MPRILAVDDSSDQLLALELHLRSGGFEVETATDGFAAIEACKQRHFDLLLLDVRMPGIDGFEVARRLKAMHGAALVPVVFLSGNLPSESARREASELGPVDFVQKPFDRDELLARIHLMLRLQEVRQRLLVENGRLGLELDAAQAALAEARATIADLRAAFASDEATVGGVDAAVAAAVRARLREREVATPSAPVAPQGYRLSGFIGESSSVRDLATMVDRLRRTRTTVLICGETGTGKELVARALHFDGPAPERPFIPIHCGALSRDLVESELFGFEKGAFTGAQQSHQGLFGAADGGTIFLDEVAEMTPELQVKLLRVLQLGEVRPIGSTQHRIVDVRVVAATNHDLEELVAQGRFRADLLHRLGVVALRTPPLRERRDDLPRLLEHFLQRGNERHQRTGRPVAGVSQAAMRRLLAYDWPGNVRELQNVCERAFALGVGEVLQEEDLPPLLRGERAVVLQAMPPVPPVATRDAAALDLRSQRAAAERAAFEQALAAAGGDRRAAAQSLGLPRSTFYRRLRELGF